MAKKRSKILEVARFMPPLKHSVPDQDFDVRNSEVVKWLLKHPYTWNYIWNCVKESGAIKYDKETGTWQGVDYDAD